MDGVIQVLGIERCATSVAIILEDFGGQSLASPRPRLDAQSSPRR